MTLPEVVQADPDAGGGQAAELDRRALGIDEDGRFGYLDHQPAGVRLGRLERLDDVADELAAPDPRAETLTATLTSA